MIFATAFLLSLTVMLVGGGFLWGAARQEDKASRYPLRWFLKQSVTREELALYCHHYVIFRCHTPWGDSAQLGGIVGDQMLITPGDYTGPIWVPVEKVRGAQPVPIDYDDWKTLCALGVQIAQERIAARRIEIEAAEAVRVAVARELDALLTTPQLSCTLPSADDRQDAAILRTPSTTDGGAAVTTQRRRHEAEEIEP